MPKLQEELQELRDKVLDMAELVQKQLNDCLKATDQHDLLLAKDVIDREKSVDRIDRKIDKRCENILALYHPLAGDLRYVFSIIKINQSFENIGDGAEYIAREMLKSPRPFEEAFTTACSLKQQIDLCWKMYSLTLDAFIGRNENVAEKAIELDDEIDRLKWEARRILTDLIQQKPNQAEQLLLLIFITQRMENIADACVRICKEIIFMADGRIYRRSKA